MRLNSNQYQKKSTRINCLTIKEYLEKNQDPIELSKKIKKIHIVPNKPYKKITIFDLISK